LIRDFSAKNIRFKIGILVFFIKVLVGNTENIRTDTFQPKIFGSKLEKNNNSRIPPQPMVAIHWMFILPMARALDAETVAWYATIRNISITCPKRG
jgi:hypothetical protein